MSRKYFSFVAILVASWCVMVTTHELGHVVSGILTGGQLIHAELRPWKLPHSHFMPDPRPLVTLWGGPILGVTVPLLAAMMIRRNWGWFIADFCLIAGGTYIALAWISHEPLLDTARLLNAGAPQWQIGLFCVVTIVPGYVRFRKRCIEWLRPTSGMFPQ
jgi:hypothetical protein